MCVVRACVRDACACVCVCVAPVCVPSCVLVCVVRAAGMGTATIWEAVTREEEGAAAVEEAEDPCHDKIAPTENTG